MEPSREFNDADTPRPTQSATMATPGTVSETIFFSPPPAEVDNTAKWQIIGAASACATISCLLVLLMVWTRCRRVDVEDFDVSDNGIHGVQLGGLGQDGAPPVGFKQRSLWLLSTHSHNAANLRIHSNGRVGSMAS